jgi:hypothetical protein
VCEFQPDVGILVVARLVKIKIKLFNVNRLTFLLRVNLNMDDRYSHGCNRSVVHLRRCSSCENKDYNNCLSYSIIMYYVL